jgi:hypothetical protein
MNWHLRETVNLIELIADILRDELGSKGYIPRLNHISDRILALQQSLAGTEVVAPAYVKRERGWSKKRRAKKS